MVTGSRSCLPLRTPGSPRAVQRTHSQTGRSMCFVLTERTTILGHDEGIGAKGKQ
jgi:hypothetical protein